MNVGFSFFLNVLLWKISIICKSRDLKPVVSLYTHINNTKCLAKGESLSYGHRYTTNKDEFISTLTIGYADGFWRKNTLRQVYINDEYGMTGGNDPDCRRGMVWDEAYQKKDVYEWYRKLIQIRNQYPVLTEGRIKDVFCDDGQGIFAITRELDEKELVLLAHAKDGEVVISNDSPLSNLIGMENLLADTTFSGKLCGFELEVLIKK